MTTIKSSTSSSTTSNLLSSTNRMGGLISGMDTDTLVEQLTSGTRNKIAKIQQQEQKAQWQRDAYREISTKLTDFSTKYFSYTNADTNILSSTFFDATTLTSSSSLVKASGNDATAKNMVVKNISSLASAANFASTKTASNQAINSGKIYTEWKASNVNSKALTINYDGKDYTITTDSEFGLNSNNTSINAVDAVIEQLNKQIENTTGLSGKVKFENIDSVAGTIKLTSIDSSQSIAIKEYKANKSDTNSSDFLTALGFTNLGTSAVGSIEATTTNASKLYNNNVEAGSHLDFTIDGTAYTLSLGANIDSSSCTDSTLTGKLIETTLNELIKANPTLKDKLSVSSTDGQISLTATSGTLAITGGSENMLNGLGLKSTDGGGNVTYSTSGTVNREKLVSSYLDDELSGSTLTFNLNGISKKLTFDESDKTSFDTASEISTYIQTKLDKLYGTGKITVATDANDALSFTTTDKASVLSITSSDNANVANVNGALRFGAGESNRLEKSKTLEQLATEISGLTANSENKYVLNVNGKEFSFDKTTTLNTVMSTINSDADAGVTIAYSSTTDTFNVTADDSGAQGKINITDTSGNLAASLFGTAGTDYTVKSGTDANLQVSFDGGKNFTNITRTANSFSLDGVSLEITGKSANATDEITFTPNSNTDDLMKKITDFINDYNKIMDAVNTQISTAPLRSPSYAPLTDTQKKNMTADEITAWETKAKVGLLQGDSSLQTLASDLRNAMSSFVKSTGTAIYQVGITTGSYKTNGQLVVDKTALQKALLENPEGISNMFTSEDGISARIKKVLDKNVGTFGGDGVLLKIAGKANSTVDKSSLTEKISDYETQIKNLKTSLEDEEDRYWSKFTAMETALSTLNQQSSSLTSMFSSSSS